MLLVMLTVVAIAVTRMRHLFGVVMLFGAYSLISALLYVLLDAVDVAFTEAAVGAGISTVLMLATLALTGEREQATPAKRKKLAFLVCLGTGLLLWWGTLDLPHYGDPDAPINHHVAPRYVEDSGTEIGVPNIVTSVLASYRGFDTLGETTVVFTAACGVICLIGLGREVNDRKKAKKGEKEGRADDAA
ncbi:MAG: DUF4040 domain-containing protein [Rhodospirillales bacterium]